MISNNGNNAVAPRRAFLGKLFLVAIGGIAYIKHLTLKASSKRSEYKKQAPEELYPEIHPQSVARKTKAD
jgi:hypothetical protein